MRKPLLAVTVAVTLLLAIVITLPAAAQKPGEAVATGANLIYNGSFERLREGKVDGWFGEGGDVCINMAYRGNQSLKLKAGAKLSALGIASCPTLKYVVGGWFRSDGNRNCGLSVDFYAPAVGLVGNITVPVTRADNEWEYIERLVEVPFEAASVSVGVYNSGDETVRADSIATIERYQARLKKIATPPVIDGCLDDPCWLNASVGDEDWITTKGKVARQQTRVFCCYDDDYLYIAFRLYTTKPRGLKADTTFDDGPVWRDDSAEIFIDHNHDHSTYCELEINPNNVEYDAWGFDRSWDCIWKHEVGFERNAWVCEIAIDLATFELRDASGRPTGRMALPTPDVWGINFSRNDFVTRESSSWPNTGRSFHNVMAYGHLLRLLPVRTAAYTAQAACRIEALRGELGVCRYVMKRAGYQRAGEKEESRRPENWALRMGDRIQANLESIAGSVKPANSYDDWLQLRADLDNAEAYLLVLRDTLQPEIARQHWAEKLGRSVDMAVSASAVPLAEQNFFPPWRLDDRLCFYMGRDDISGFGIAVDAFAELKQVRAEVAVAGLLEAPVALVHAPGPQPQESFHWPAPAPDLAAGQQAIFWVPLQTDATTPPGTYSGTLTVSAAGQPDLAMPFSVQVWGFEVPRCEKPLLSVLHPDFSAMDISSQLAGFGLPAGTVAVFALPFPEDGEAYSLDEAAGILACAAEAWTAFRQNRPELNGYMLGVPTENSELYPQLAKLYAALKLALPDCRIMQLIGNPDTPSPAQLDEWVDIWAVSSAAWESTALGREGDDERWLYYRLPPSALAGNSLLADARMQPWIARHLEADGIVWGLACGADEAVPFPMFEMYCRMIAMGRRDCDYFAYLDRLRTEDLRAKTGKNYPPRHYRLSGSAYRATLLYPGLIKTPVWYNADYLAMCDKRLTCGKLITRIHRYLRPLAD